jgi:hypothetical protein
MPTADAKLADIARRLAVAILCAARHRDLESKRDVAIIQRELIRAFREEQGRYSEYPHSVLQSSGKQQ